MGCECGDCDSRMTDCCEVPRWACETAVMLDGAGDPDVTVCKRGFGCDTEEAMWERFNAEQQKQPKGGMPHEG